MSFPKADDGLKSLSPTPDGLFGPSTPCRDEKKYDYKASPPPQRERDFFASTPTDFAHDYGKHYPTSFDTSNVLAWLNSPNPNQLFSPGGGFASMLNSPRFHPRTPRTPTVSTSFFFSDVASLPKNSATKGSGNRDGNGRENIICISPLASKTNTASTPMNLKDVFNSPPRPCDGRLPMLSDTPLPKPHIGSTSDDLKSGDGADALQQVERDLMEDEDLSVLLQLASNAASAAMKSSSSPTPTRPHDGGNSVFRSQEKPSDLPRLHLPMNLNGKLTGGFDEPPKILRKKSSSREDDDAVFPPPALNMRSHSSGGLANEFFSHIGDGPIKNETADNTNLDTKPAATETGKKKPNGMNKLASLSAAAAASGQGASSNPYQPLPLNPNGHYYNIAPAPPKGAHAPIAPVSIPPGAATGSLRVVIGGPVPPNCQPDGAGSMMRPSDGSASLYHGEYTNGLPASSYAHHPAGMYAHSQFGQPPMGYRYPPPGHYPGVSPPPSAGARNHMSLFSSPQDMEANAKKGSKSKSPKTATGTKRPAATAEKSGQSVDGSDKKSKKSRSDGAGKKKKNRSPLVADKQKCAEMILAVNAASGGMHDKEAELAAAIMRGVTMRPSGKWQAQLYFAGKSRYIGVFDSREKAALAYEIAREKLKAGPKGESNPKMTENLVNLARKAAFDGVNEKLPND